MKELNRLIRENGFDVEYVKTLNDFSFYRFNQFIDYGVQVTSTVGFSIFLPNCNVTLNNIETLISLLSKTEKFVNEISQTKFSFSEEKNAIDVNSSLLNQKLSSQRLTAQLRAKNLSDVESEISKKVEKYNFNVYYIKNFENSLVFSFYKEIKDSKIYITYDFINDVFILGFAEMTLTPPELPNLIDALRSAKLLVEELF